MEMASPTIAAEFKARVWSSEGEWRGGSPAEVAWVRLCSAKTLQEQLAILEHYWSNNPA